MRCAQRGCKSPNDATTAEGAVCPVCHNPLIVAIEPEDAAEFSGEVSQEQLPVVGEDGHPIPAVAE